MNSRLNQFQKEYFEYGNQMRSELHSSRMELFSSLDHKYVCDPTALSDYNYLTDLVTSRPLNCTNRNYEISFQASFIQQHQKALKKQTRNFIESCLRHESVQENSFNLSAVFGEELGYSNFFNMEVNFSKFPSIEQFLKETQNHEKLIQFYELIFKVLPKQVAIELIYLASCAWRDFSKPSSNIDFTQEELLQKGKIMAEKQYDALFRDERIKFLNFSQIASLKLSNKLEMREAFRKYVQFLAATIYLISEEYFENPYHLQVQNKRERQEQRIGGIEDEQADSFVLGVPIKKLH